MSPRQENIYFFCTKDEPSIVEGSSFFYVSYDPARSGNEVSSTHKNVKKRDFTAPTGSIVV